MLPTVIYELGMTGTAEAQLMTMPTYAFGCACLVLIGWLIHRKLVSPWAASIASEFFPSRPPRASLTISFKSKQ